MDIFLCYGLLILRQMYIVLEIVLPYNSVNAHTPMRIIEKSIQE